MDADELARYRRARLVVAAWPNAFERGWVWLMRRCYQRSDRGVWGWLGDRCDDVCLWSWDVRARLWVRRNRRRGVAR